MATSPGGRPTTAVIAAVFGGVIGAGLFAWLGRGDAAPAPRPSRGEPQVAEPAREPARRPNLESFRTSALEERVQALEESQKKKEEEPVTEEEAAEPPSQREVEAQHDARVQAHRAEELNPRWARDTSAAFTTDFQRADGTNFKVADVECRSTTCSVVLEWPSRETALAEWRRALMQPTRANCGRSIVVPEQPAGAEGPVRATLLLDCADWVEQGSQLLHEDQLPTLAP